MAENRNASFLQVTDEYYITSDSNSWALGKRYYNEKKDQWVFQKEKYSGSILFLINSLSKKLLRESQYHSIAELVVNQRNIMNEIASHLVKAGLHPSLKKKIREELYNQV